MPISASPLHCTRPPPLDEARYYRAFANKYAAFDGLFFLRVRSTGIYCRPVCRVRLGKPQNCHFFGSAAQAEACGFRPCLRCRPELAPAQRCWSATDAIALLAQACVQRIEAALTQGQPALSMTTLAAQLGVSDRHLRRVFEQHWQISPLQYRQTRRLLPAKRWLQDSTLAVARVAQISGFGSTQSVNTAFAQHYQLTPRQLRPAISQRSAPEQAITLQLAYRPPCQQITIKAARTLGQRLLQTFGEACTTPWPALSRCFPTPCALLEPDAAERMGALGTVRQHPRSAQALEQLGRGWQPYRSYALIAAWRAPNATPLHPAQPNGKPCHE
jgi:methylphosphotriester-DNA--protein-cysteine methyltransferase